MVQTLFQTPTQKDFFLWVEKNDERKIWFLREEKNIIFSEHCITILGLSFSLQDLVEKANNVDIWSNGQYTYFSYEAALRESGKLNLRLPTREEWQQLIDYLPGKKYSDKVSFLIEVFHFPLGGFRCRDNSFFCNFWLDSGYWSSTSTSTHAYNLHFRNDYINCHDLDFKEIGFMVRCIKK